MAAKVRNTPGAVSYLGLAFVNESGLRTLGIQRPDGLVMPTRDVVSRLQWPIGGPAVAITKGQPTPLANAFLTYMISPSFESDPAWQRLGYVVPSKPLIGSALGQ